MRSNRSIDSKPELALRRALHRLGLRYRKHYRLDLADLRVRPDVVFIAARVAVFVDGCFWHRCPIHASDPKANSEYWGPKLRRNVARDRRVDRALEEAGWSVVRVWEHEAVDEAAARIAATVSTARKEARARIIR